MVLERLEYYSENERPRLHCRAGSEGNQLYYDIVPQKRVTKGSLEVGHRVKLDHPVSP